jgi:hypothetical protein
LIKNGYMSFVGEIILSYDFRANFLKSLIWEKRDKEKSKKNKCNGDD